jgi:hypothetical protein
LVYGSLFIGQPSGEWQPNRDKDELTYALGNPEHGGRTRGYGSVSWEHAFPQDRETYRSRQRKKEEDRERLRQLEEAITKTSEVARKALEREEALKATINEQIRKAVEEVVSSRLQSFTAGRQRQPRLSSVEKQSCFYGGACEAR